MALNPEEKAVVAKLARKVVHHGLTVPAIISLEIHRPLSFLASQLMHCLTPFVSMVLDAKEFQTFASMLERRDTIEDVIVAIEEADAQ